MTAAVEDTWRVELTCSKLRQYSCDSAVLRCSTAFRVRTTVQISVVLVPRTPARSGEKR
jgi:hypothetical protein